jgi:hypothetical protein
MINNQYAKSSSHYNLDNIPDPYEDLHIIIPADAPDMIKWVDYYQQLHST